MRAYPFFIDSAYIYLVLPAIIFALYAQAKVKGTFEKYSKEMSFSGFTGAEIARQILNQAGLYNVPVERVSGNLSDHYDPRNRVLKLSDSVYGSRSVAAIGVAAHEVGHAIQHGNNYIFLTLRNSIVPVVNLSSKLAMPLIMLGILFSWLARSAYGMVFIKVGIILFAAVVLFQLITLPVELNASNRAIRILGSSNYLSDTELKKARKVLNAAALTYVAAAAVSLANLLRLIILFGGRRDD